MFNFFKKKNKNVSLVPEIVVSDVPGSINECYTRLRDNIIYYSDSGKNKVFQIESAISGEGKSTVTANLAVSLVKSGKKVLLVDLDFRKPMIHKIFKIVNLNGLVEYMLDECDKSSLIKTTEYGVDVINRGKTDHNTSLIFMADKFKAIIDEFKKDYDVVLLDCPPVLQVSDYIHISKISDSVIYVVSSGKVRTSQVKEALSLLRREDIKIFGTVLTAMTTPKSYKNRYDYYGGYYAEK